jgi:Ca2+-binding RTX toxin-like protein
MKIESLEIRRLLTATVTENYPGYYEIDGDESADTIEVSVSQGDQSFTVDGQTYSNACYITVFGNGGDDNISVLSSDAPGNVGAAIAGGDGNDTITLNFDGAIYGCGGNDTINIRDSFQGEVYGGDGDDHMTVSGACVYAEIEGNDGNDYIDCSANDYSVVVHGGSGSDTIIGSEHDDDLHGDEGSDYLDGRGGNDTLYAQYGQSDTVIGGTGFDILRTSGSEVSITDIEQVV